VEGARYVVRPSAYAIARNADGELAVVRTPGGCFLPGGGIEPGETAEQAVAREAREECGLVLEPRASIGKAVEIVYSARKHTCFEKRSTFITTDVVGAGAPEETDHELLWLDIDRALDQLSRGSHRWIVRTAVKRQNPEARGTP
jgi:8-oxo-dGTP diphosphatase